MIKKIIVFLLSAVFVCGCSKQEAVKEAEPLIIEHASRLTENEVFQNAVEERVNKILSKNVVLTVYSEGVEDFCYRGTLEVIDDGTDDSDLIIFIHCDQPKTSESDWW